jgi:uncharacterized protein (TIGR03435 family)
MKKLVLTTTLGVLMIVAGPSSAQIGKFELVLANPDGTLGPNLRPAATDCATLRTGVASSANPCGLVRGLGKLTANGLGMDQFAGMLSSAAGITVVDRTGLAGSFDWDLTWTPDNLRGHAPDRFPSVAPDGPSVFAALEQQLGLRLVPAP